MPRGTLAGHLATMGFTDTARAEALLGELGLTVGRSDGSEAGGPAGSADEDSDAQLLHALAAAADPDLALAALARMDPDRELRQALRDDPELRDRLVSVLGASAALGDHLSRHRADWRLLAGPCPFPEENTAAQLTGELLAAVGAGSTPDPSAPDGADPATALRIAYRRRLLQLAALDLTGARSLDEVMTGLSDLAARGA